MIPLTIKGDDERRFKEIAKKAQVCIWYLEVAGAVFWDFRETALDHNWTTEVWGAINVGLTFLVYKTTKVSLILNYMVGSGFNITLH